MLPIRLLKATITKLIHPLCCHQYVDRLNATKKYNPQRINARPSYKPIKIHNHRLATQQTHWDTILSLLSEQTSNFAVIKLDAKEKHAVHVHKTALKYQHE